MFVRYECGCVGIVVDGTSTVAEEQIHWCVSSCEDGKHGPIKLYDRSRGLAVKNRKKLTPNEVIELLEDMQDLIADGHSFRELKTLLGLPGPLE